MVAFLRTHFRCPQVVPLLFIIVATITTSGLGVWQLKRLAWKEDIVAAAVQARDLPVLGSLPPEIDGITYRKVNLTGTFLYDKVLHMIGRQEGNFPGYFMVTPFKLEDDGRIILVNRGFSPVGKESRPAGEQRVEGIIRPFRDKRYFAPANVPEKNVWFYEDVPAMSKSSGLELTPLMVEVVAKVGSPKGEFPIAGKGEVLLRNDHLGYAITWFGLSLVGLVMFAFYHRKKA
jgi:surfeit locus 1 family protein